MLFDREDDELLISDRNFNRFDSFHSRASDSEQRSSRNSHVVVLRDNYRNSKIQRKRKVTAITTVDDRRSESELLVCI